MESNREPKSPPLQAFESNLDNLRRLWKLRRGYAEHTLGGLQKDIESIVHLPDYQRSKALDSFLTSLAERSQKVTDAFVKTFPFLNDWELVMLVSFTEAYLEDVLILLAQKNPRWMQESTQSISYAELLGASSLPDLVGQMQRRWAKNILGGTPQKWVERLKSFGATGYAADLGKDMKEVWGRRHATVHSPGTSVHITVAEFQKALDVIKAFVDPTDKFVVALPSVPLPPPET